jgi:thioredoxin-like negative regulator of GroEL
MKVVVLYRPSSEHSRKVEEFAHDLERRGSGKVELVSVDTRDGSATASLYDVMQYPAVLALKNDGQLLKDWQGNTMPLLNEVSYYTSTW